MQMRYRPQSPSYGTRRAKMSREFLEFFAGAGMARAALEASGWTCAFANDFDFKKAATYRANWHREGQASVLRVEDVRKVRPEDVPTANLAWASFPCQDLSLAGGGAGLKGERSGTFYPFWNLVCEMIRKKRGPELIALENVTGTLTSHAGADFAAICQAFAEVGYRYGALVIDAELFVPHSRRRLFVVGVRHDIAIPEGLIAAAPSGAFHTPALRYAQERLPAEARDQWVWWNLPSPPKREHTFADIIEEEPESVAWHSRSETDAILGMMSPINLAKVAAAKRAGRRVVGSVYRRTRRDEHGRKVQRAEVRFDDVAGCLRTPAGGSSRQVIMLVEGRSVRTRLISARETARLMGLPDTYQLPTRYNDAYHLTGDGVVVPVVGFLTDNLFNRLVRPVPFSRRRAA